MAYDGRMHRSPAAVLESLRTLIAGADEEVVLSLSIGTLEAVESALAAAVDRDVFVLLLTHSYDGDVPEPDRFEGVADVVRWTPEQGNVFCIADKRSGLNAHRLMFEQEGEEIDYEYRQATTIENPLFAQALYGYLLADSWRVADEVYAAPPVGLPATFENHRRAVVEATLYLREGHSLAFTGEVRSNEDRDRVTTLEGTVVNARQTVVRPISSSFPSEHSLVCRVDGERTTVGGKGSFKEDFEGLELTFEAVR